MSRENLEIVMAAIRGFEANDVEGYAALWHPNSHITAPDEWPEAGPFVGRDAVIAEFERVAADWSENRFEGVEVVADSGEWVVVTYRWHARGAASGIETHFDHAVAYRVQGGSIIEAHFRWKRDDALEAAGLSE